MQHHLDRLNELNVGKTAIIEDIKAKGAIRRRLIDLGFAKGSRTTCIGVAPFGDPKAYFIKGTIIALRKEDSSNIIISQSFPNP